MQGHASKMLHCHEKIVKSNSGEGLQGEEESCRESLNLLREFLSGHEQCWWKHQWSQLEMRKMLQDNGEEAILVIKW